jgi:sec-independent protein translocase protein TatC
MSLAEHLDELRWCLIKSLVAVALLSGVCYFFSDFLFALMVAPLKENLRPGQSLIGTGVTEAFFTEIKVALVGGITLSCPVIFYQIWRFISPGLFLLSRRAPRRLPLFYRAVRNDGGDPGDSDG